ncbi:MAG: hypothetical protein ABR521_12915 [Gaiellaceae bacterium]
MATKVATVWGAAQVVEEIRLPQRAGEKRFAVVVQLLEGTRGEAFVRFAYSTDGVARRGPVTFRARDLERLRAKLGEHELLANALGLGGGMAGRRLRRRPQEHGRARAPSEPTARAHPGRDPRS